MLWMKRVVPCQYVFCSRCPPLVAVYRCLLVRMPSVSTIAKTTNRSHPAFCAWLTSVPIAPRRDIQILKGCMRETETDRVWACSKMPMNRLHHLRSKYVHFAVLRL
jgi:hypothetical protein